MSANVLDSEWSEECTRVALMFVFYISKFLNFFYGQPKMCSDIYKLHVYAFIGCRFSTIFCIDGTLERQNIDVVKTKSENSRKEGKQNNKSKQEIYLEILDKRSIG